MEQVPGSRPLRASSITDYRAWVERVETRGLPHMSSVRALPYRPLFTILAAGDDVARAAARTMLAAQSCDEWELVASLDAAAGAFVGGLDAGDILSPDALLEMIALLNTEPDADIVYADDDLDGGIGGRASPRFRTGWDPDLLLGGDPLGGLTLYRRDLLDRIDAERLWEDRYALALRAAWATTPDRIHHVPRVLCHVARRIGAGPRTVAAAQSHLDAISPGARVSRSGFGRHRVEWPISERPPLVSIIVPTRDRADLLGRCVDGLLHRTDYPEIELLVVDNDSTDGGTVALLDRLASDGRVRLLREPGPFNHSAINNRAACEARGEVLALLNNDVEIIDAGWLRELVSQALRPDVGAVGAKLLTADGRVQHGGVTVAPGPIAKHVLDGADRADAGWNGQLAIAREFSAVTAACLAIRRGVFDEVGGFDAVAFPTSYNDLDLCFRIREHGYRVIWTPFAELVHHGSASRPRLVTEAALAADAADLDRLWRRWPGEIETDPFSHPALQLFDTADVLLVPPGERRA